MPMDNEGFRYIVPLYTEFTFHYMIQAFTVFANKKNTTQNANSWKSTIITLVLQICFQNH